MNDSHQSKLIVVFEAGVSLFWRPELICTEEV